MLTTIYFFVLHLDKTIKISFIGRHGGAERLHFKEETKEDI